MAASDEMRNPSMTHLATLTAVTVIAAACSPGTGEVFRPDAGARDSSSSNSLPDASLHGDMPPPTPDSGTPPDLAVPLVDMAAPEPDLGAMPSRVWTAESDGTIAWWTFDPASGSLTQDGSIERGGSLNFLALSADRSKLYAVNEDRVEAFDITTLPPAFLGDADAGVAGTGTHLAVDATNSHVFVAWYGGDAVSMLPLGADGAPSDATVVLGGGADPDYCRRAHQIRIHPSNNFVYAPCLASDHVVGLSYDATTGDLTPIGEFSTPAGAGPRHMDFHPTLEQTYVIGELDDTITRFEVDPGTGVLTMLDTISTRPNPSDTLGPASDVHVSPDGNWVVGINRNPRDEVVTFALGADGAMSDPRWVATGGEHARTFAFSPRGGYLTLGNSNSMDVTIFRFDNGDATLLDTIGGFDARVMFIGFE